MRRFTILSMEIIKSEKFYIMDALLESNQHIQYWTVRIAQIALLWSKTTLITGGVGEAGVDTPSWKTDTFCSIIKPRAFKFNQINAAQDVPGSSHGSGDSAHFYCGNSLHSLFWTYHSLKYMPSMQNPEWKTFLVNWISGPCVCIIFSIVIDS